MNHLCAGGSAAEAEAEVSASLRAERGARPPRRAGGGGGAAARPGRRGAGRRRGCRACRRRWARCARCSTGRGRSRPRSPTRPLARRSIARCGRSRRAAGSSRWSGPRRWCAPGGRRSRAPPWGSPATRRAPSTPWPPRRSSPTWRWTGCAAAARRNLSFRTGREAEGGSDAEWEGGRLYRLSARAGPILRQREERRTGHLFADVKDFTRRTALLGQASMAEFLRREFYGPILTAAKEHFGGMGHLADRGGVALNNLLGDAISFCGRIDVLVFLAKVDPLPARRLRHAAGARGVDRGGGQAARGHRGRPRRRRWARPARRGRQAEALLAEAAARARPARPRAGARSTAPGSRRRGSPPSGSGPWRGPGARPWRPGAFISFGPEPLVVVIEDEVFGRNRVAIAEKINESARGTARAASARLRADAALERERAPPRQPGSAPRLERLHRPAASAAGAAGGRGGCRPGLARRRRAQAAMRLLSGAGPRGALVRGGGRGPIDQAATSTTAARRSPRRRWRRSWPRCSEAGRCAG